METGIQNDEQITWIRFSFKAKTDESDLHHQDLPGHQNSK